MSPRSARAATVVRRDLPDADSLRTDLRERRTRIVDAAARLMVRVDYDKIQVKDVADEAQVALGTLYRYFNSKDHLFACALVSWSCGFGDRLERSSGGRSIDRVKTIYRRAVTAFERQPRVYGVMMHVQSSTDGRAVEVFRQFAGQQSDAFSLAVQGIPSPRRDDVVAVMSAVLDENLRFWQLGLQPIASVYTAVDRAADLIFRR